MNRSKSAGVRDLKRFLQFAEQGEEAFKRELAVDLTAEFDSPFEAEVAAALEQRGWTVHRQVGCSGYRIDLAVVDPAHPGRYLLGVECDGATYHSAPSARDRDKVRQSVLEDLGWRMHRIWSTDWWENREREIEDVAAALEHARAAPAVELIAEEPHVVAEAPVASAPAPASASVVATAAPASSVPIAPISPAERVRRVLGALRAEPDGRPYGDALTPYRVATLDVEHARADFYEESSTARIAAALREVVRQEAPILESLAARRVGELWGFRRMKSKALERIAACVAGAGLHATQEGAERVFWADAADAGAFRGARLPLDGDEGAERSIDEVPLVELAELLCFWIDEAGPMPERDLLEHANRSLGFRRMGAKIRARLTAALALALERGALDQGSENVRRSRDGERT